jgi:hypothetical protein
MATVSPYQPVAHYLLRAVPTPRPQGLEPLLFICKSPNVETGPGFDRYCRRRVTLRSGVRISFESFSGCIPISKAKVQCDKRYVNHCMDVIYLAGLPDIRESPHAKVNGWGLARWEVRKRRN